MQRLRETIRRAAPDATEAISYLMPTFKYRGRNLVHFAGYERHIGFYPGGIIDRWRDELSGFKTGRGSVQFPHDRPLPLALVRRIVRARIADEDARVKR